MLPRGLLIVFLFTFSQSAVAEPTRLDALRAFGEIAFGTEFFPAEVQYIRKWTGKVDVFFHNEAGSDIGQFFEKHLQQLREYTGLDIRRTDDQLNATIQVFITNDVEQIRAFERTAHARIRGRVSEIGCSALAMARGEAPGEYVFAIAVIPAFFPDKILRHCILEETTQVFGLANDTSAIGESIFNQDVQPTSLSRLDIVLLRLLYDERIAPGASKSDAIRIAVDVLNDIMSSE